MIAGQLDTAQPEDSERFLLVKILSGIALLAHAADQMEIKMSQLTDHLAALQAAVDAEVRDDAAQAELLAQTEEAKAQAEVRIAQLQAELDALRGEVASADQAIGAATEQLQANDPQPTPVEPPPADPQPQPEPTPAVEPTPVVDPAPAADPVVAVDPAPVEQTPFA